MQVRSCKMINYEVIENVFGTTIKAIMEDGTELWIPADPANSDYQRYLNPEQNTITKGSN